MSGFFFVIVVAVTFMVLVAMSIMIVVRIMAVV